MATGVRMTSTKSEADVIDECAKECELGGGELGRYFARRIRALLGGPTLLERSQAPLATTLDPREAMQSIAEIALEGMRRDCDRYRFEEIRTIVNTMLNGGTP